MNSFLSDALDWVYRNVIAISERDPAFRVGPLDYTHRVKYPGRRAVEVSDLKAQIGRTLSASDGLTIYHHVPACPYRCTYCHYPSFVDKGNLRQYVVTTLAEARNFLDFFPEAGRLEARSLYVGGGTPALLSDSLTHEILDFYRAHFQIADGAEITWEGTPDTLPEHRIQSLAAAGVNRLSIGVQTLNDELLRYFHRAHQANDALRAIQNALDIGFSQVNVDLIYGLPGQSLGEFRKDVERVAGAGPHSVTLYRLRLQRTDELPTGLYQTYKDGTRGFPEPAIVYAMQVIGRRVLNDAAYCESPAGWFHAPEQEAQVYSDRWRRQLPLAAFGWWTYSYSRDYEFYNHSIRQKYKAAVDNGQLPVERAAVYEEDERLRRFVSFRLKIDGRLDRSAVVDRFGDVGYSALEPVRSRLSRLGMIREDKRGFALSETGWVLLEEILERILS